MGAQYARAPYAQSSNPAASSKSSTSNDSGVEGPVSIRVRQAGYYHCRVHVLTVRLLPVRGKSDLGLTSHYSDTLRRSGYP
jgi:hypothetical protein